MMSFMLFAMGLGSHLSRYLGKNLLDTFTVLEFSLSLLCASAAAAAYALSPFLNNVGLVIYPFGIAIGLLIGMEIPLIARVNAAYEELRVNISSVMVKDSYGALLGGMFFAFVGLPYLGLSYTPVILGAVNFCIASLFLFRFRSLLAAPRLLSGAWAVVGAGLIGLFFLAEPIVLFGEQALYKDTVILVKQTPYQRLVMTRWRNDYWLYINGNEQFSSYDEERYHEPLVHPAMSLSGSRTNILILGGGDGLAAREALKYSEVRSIVVVDIDPAITDMGQNHPIFLNLNKDALNHPRVKIVNQDAYKYLKESNRLYDVVIIDLPDPKTIGLARLYSSQFYRLVVRHLSRGGVVVTQATSPFFSKKAFLSILKSMRSVGVPTVAYHNHIPTLGEWGWVLSMNAPNIAASQLKLQLTKLEFSDIETKFLSRDAMLSMLHFGKGILDGLEEISVNDELDLAVFQYYRDGSWDLY